MFELILPNGNIFQIVDDEHNDNSYIVRILNPERNHIFSELNLAPLWLARPDAFAEGDFYQKTFASYPPRQGHGINLFQLLLENSEQIPLLNNLYSTSWNADNNIDDTDFITIEANYFWGNLVANEQAERLEDIARYRVIPALLV